MTLSGESDIEAVRARALELVPTMAPLLRLSTSELRRRVMTASDDKLRAAVSAFEDLQMMANHMGGADVG